MTHVPRCLVPDLEAEPLALDRDARHHLGRVLRLRPGDPFEVLDGRGGRLLAAWRGAGDPEILRRDPPAPPPASPVRVALASPRPSRLDWLVEKAAELDVAELLLLECARSVRSPGTPRLERLARKADEALLQCGRLHRMLIAGPVSLDALLASARGQELWLASPPGADGPPALPPGRAERPLLVLVGPEGGFDEAEQCAAVAAGARPVALGHTTLRVETAALALAVLAQVLAPD